MNINKYQNIYLIGVGGIGMSALARYFLKKGSSVYGYDEVRSDLCIELEKDGINIHYKASVQSIPDIFKRKDELYKLIIYTPAVTQENKELSYFFENGFEIFKRAEVLGMISKDYYTIAVAGTHGKTTTSCILAHILKNSGRECTAFLGGISKNYNTNFLYGNQNEVLIVEADEFDRSFLNLHVDIAVITSIDNDHLDVYKDYEDLCKSFLEFTSNVKKGGTLIVERDVTKRLLFKEKNQSVSSYSVTGGSEVNYYATNVRVQGGKTRFSIETYNPQDSNITSSNIHKHNQEIFYSSHTTDLEFHMPGEHNLSNALAAITVCRFLNLNDYEIASGIKSFEGIKRRYDMQIIRDNLVFVDDYAHHPKEIKATIDTTRKLFPKRKITVVFQPHLFSRTQKLISEFAEALSLASELIILDIYPAREVPIPGISSKSLLDRCSLSQKEICTKDRLLKLLSSKKIDILLTLGAGDIDSLVKPIKHMLN